MAVKAQFIAGQWQAGSGATMSKLAPEDQSLLWQAATQMGEECTIWAEGAAARAVAGALPFLKGVKVARLEAEALNIHGNAAYMEHFNVPGIMLVGGIEGCLELTDCPVETF